MEAAPVMWNMIYPSWPSMDQERGKYGLLAVCLFEKLAVWFNIALYPITKCIQFQSVNFYVIPIKIVFHGYVSFLMTILLSRIYRKDHLKKQITHATSYTPLSFFYHLRSNKYAYREKNMFLWWTVNLEWWPNMFFCWVSYFWFRKHN